MAELLHTVDHTEAGEDGWRVTHHVRRSDGEEIEIEVFCTKTAESIFREMGDAEGTAALDDRGRAEALRAAESALPRRGPTRIRLSFDHASGSIRRDINYTWPPAAALPPQASR
jgi:hypothetical protein